MDFINLLKREQKPALGCTEPGAIALAAAKAAEYLKFPVKRIQLSLSRNMMKNAMNVGIAGTTEKGSAMAAALGAIAGKSEFGLECLKEITREQIAQARTFVDRGAVDIMLENTEEKVYVNVRCFTDTESASVTIRQDHDLITRIVINGDVIYDMPIETTVKNEETGEDFTFSDILDFIDHVSVKDLEFLTEAVTLNKKLAEEGLNSRYGLCVGRNLYKQMRENPAQCRAGEYAVSCAAAAVDARMAGCRLPVMSLNGSGNQGITATVPVFVIGKKTGVSRETLIKSLALSELVTLYIKKYIGKLSAICACAIASSAGVSCGIVYMNGGSRQQMACAIKNMIADISGLICDGAKETCALKIATGVSSALQCAYLALEDSPEIDGKEGIIDEELDQTIRNLGRLATEGMTPTDKVILDIMTYRQEETL